MNRRRSRTSFDCPHRRVGCEGYELRAYKLEPITCPFQELAYKIEVLLYAFAPWLMSVRKVDVSDKFCVPHGNPRPTCGICPEHIALEVRIIQFCRYGTDKVRLFLQAAIRAAKEEGGGAAGARGGDDRRTTGGETLPSRVRFFCAVSHHLLPQADYWRAEFAKVEMALEQAKAEERSTSWGNESDNDLFQV